MILVYTDATGLVYKFGDFELETNVLEGQSYIEVPDDTDCSNHIVQDGVLVALPPIPEPLNVAVFKGRQLLRATDACMVTDSDLTEAELTTVTDFRAAVRVIIADLNESEDTSSYVYPELPHCATMV